MATLPLRVDRTLPTPLPAQIATQVRGLVLTGTLTQGDRLPSSRALARDLGVSRAVTEQAYEQLLAEGWLRARRGAGTFIAPATLGENRPTPPGQPATAHRSDLVRLDTGTPWIDPAHQAGWRRAWREVSAAPPPRGYDDSQGLLELRAALAERLARTRGLHVHPDEIVVTSGTADGLRQVLPELPPGAVAVEDPGYRAAAETVRLAGRDLVDLRAGVPVADLSGCAAAYVTPAHQHPLGMVMSAADRLTLLTTATDAGALVVEDDYDSEFRYDVAPVPALATLDRHRVAYVGTAAKVVSPSLRLGWLVAPAPVTEAILRRRAITHAGAAWPSQRALLTLLRDGWVDKVVRSARRVYADRAPRVAAALTPYADLAGPLAGMYSTWLLPHTDAVRAREAARDAGFDVPLLTDYTRSSGLTGLVVGFGGVTDDELDRALDALVTELAE